MELNLCLPNLNLKITYLKTDTISCDSKVYKVLFFFGANVHFVILFILQSSHSVTCINSSAMLMVFMICGMVDMNLWPIREGFVSFA